MKKEPQTKIIGLFLLQLNFLTPNREYKLSKAEHDPGESFGLELNPSESELFRNLFSNQSEKGFVSRLMKNN